MKFFFAWLVLGLLAACSGAKHVTIQTLRPADITMPAQVQTILLLDRTEVDKSDWLSIGESILTGELPFEDRAAAQEALNALKNKLQQSPRYQIKIASERWVGNSISAVFPQPIPWSDQQRLLNRYQADALVTIEIMDSDFIVTNGMRKVTREVKRNGEKVEVEVDEYYAEGVANIKLGFRYYYPASREIIDQQLINETKTWQAAANSKAQALAQLIGKAEATQILCAAAGNDYAYKLAPLPITLNRTFYTKAKESLALEQGARLAEVDQWQEAINVWQVGIAKATETKDAGRMALNIAVAYEVLGDFKEALNWAQKAYTQYGNKKAKTYVQTLSRRIADEARLNKQMQNN